MKKASIKDVAKEAGVSISTVSNALNNVDVVTEDTRMKVISAAKKLNYVPNQIGRQLKSGKTSMIGFYTKSIDPPYFSTVADTIAREVNSKGYGLSILMSQEKNRIIPHLLNGSIDGLISFDEILDDNDVMKLKNSGLKTVYMDRIIEGQNISSVTFASKQMGRIITDYLISRGHRAIGFIKGFDGVYDSDERFKGYIESLNESRIEFREEWIFEGGFIEELSYSNTKLWLEKVKTLPTAIVCGNDSSAIGVIRAFKERGIDVPDKVSLVSFDDIPLLNYISPKLTTFHTPIQEQGKKAVELLFDMINHNKRGKNIVLEGHLVERESVKKLSEDTDEKK